MREWRAVTTFGGDSMSAELDVETVLNNMEQQRWTIFAVTQSGDTYTVIAWRQIVCRDPLPLRDPDHA